MALTGVFVTFTHAAAGASVYGAAAASETVASGTSTTNTSQHPNDIVRITADDAGAYYVAIAASPNPNTSPRWYVRAGETIDVMVGAPNLKVGVVSV